MVSLSVPVALSVSEEDVMVCVNLTGALERDVLVQVTTVDGTARGKYSPSPNPPSPSSPSLTLTALTLPVLTLPALTYQC